MIEGDVAFVNHLPVDDLVGNPPPAKDSRAHRRRGALVLDKLVLLALSLGESRSRQDTRQIRKHQKENCEGRRKAARKLCHVKKKPPGEPNLENGKSSGRAFASLT